MSMFYGWKRQTYSDSDDVTDVTDEAESKNLAYEILTDAIKQADWLSRYSNTLTRVQLRAANQQLIDTVADAYNAATAEDIERMDKIRVKIDRVLAGIEA